MKYYTSVNGVLQCPKEGDAQHGWGYQTMCLGLSAIFTACHGVDPCECLCRFKILKKIWGSVESNRPKGEGIDPRSFDEHLNAGYWIGVN